MAMAGTLAAGTATAQTSSPDTRAATAAPACPYPYVCIYKDDARIGMFQDVTSTWQNLPSRPTGPNLHVVNTRKDDVAYIRQSDGTITCIAPNSSFGFPYSQPALTGIRISSEATCR
ncbi:hypothetical protein [Streptomyces asiaticus]|uniref:hypothetical protein n=1 Tax=Streptomyces asiaticus TaxID=114695 RepID=UPI003F680CCE